VLGPPLAAGRRDHHVPLGASQSRFLPFLSALPSYLEGSVVATGCASFTHVNHEPPLPILSTLSSPTSVLHY
jgi:hypothetical protein